VIRWIASCSESVEGYDQDIWLRERHWISPHPWTRWF
jgi:hypothetical protein